MDELFEHKENFYSKRRTKNDFFSFLFSEGKKKKPKYTTLLPVMDGGLWDTAGAPLIVGAICQQELRAQIRPH